MIINVMNHIKVYESLGSISFYVLLCDPINLVILICQNSKIKQNH